MLKINSNLVVARRYDHFYFFSRTLTPTANIFNYGYDKLNRLSTSGKTNGSMTENLNYDVMGNIWQLKRDGAGLNQYHFAGNRLSSVDNVTGVYQYDANGIAVTDGRNGILVT